MVRAIGIGKTPPAVQLSENQIHPASAALVLQRHQLPRRRQEFPAVVQRLVQVARRVQHVGCNQQVIAVGIEALRQRVPFNIQHPVFHGVVIISETRLRFRKKSGGYIRIRVAEATGRKLRQDAIGRRSDARSDLQHSQHPAARQFGHKRLHHFPQHPVRRSPHRRIPVEIGSRWFFLSE